MPRARPVSRPARSFDVLHFSLPCDRLGAAMSDKPPPDRTLYVSPTQPGIPVEVGWISRFVFDVSGSQHSIVVVLGGGAEGYPVGYPAELSARLRETFPGIPVEVL